MANAGVVGMAEVVVPNSSTTQGGLAGSNVMWSYVWVGISALFLLFCHMAMLGRRGR